MFLWHFFSNSMELCAHNLKEYSQHTKNANKTIYPFFVGESRNVEIGADQDLCATYLGNIIFLIFVFIEGLMQCVSYVPV